MVTVSQRLRSAVWAKRAEGVKQFQLAQAADVHPSIFSAIVCDIIPIQPNDERVIRIGAVVGLTPEQCFDVREDRR
jgi:hypothetical protein